MACVIVWIDESGSIFLSNEDKLVSMDGTPKTLAYTKKKDRGEIVFRTKYCYVVFLPKTKNFVFVPIRLHHNDFQPEWDGKSGKCEVVVMHTNGHRKVAVLAKLYDELTAAGAKADKPGQKRALEIKDEPESDVEVEEPKKKKKKTDPEETTVVTPEEKNVVTNFWTMDFGTVQSSNANADFEMDVDDDAEEGGNKKTHKQGPSETDIRNLEEALASSTNIPSSVAEFERLVLATPNNSLIWIKFMVFHLQALEVDKARHVFRRVLKSINFRWQDDILNVWVAYLNLELRYGTTETFEQAFTEALATNDQFKVTTRTIEILADSEKVAMCKAKATIAMKKFKERAELWPRVGAAYFRLGLKEEANQLVNKALAALDKRDRKFNLILKMLNSFVF